MGKQAGTKERGKMGIRETRIAAGPLLMMPPSAGKLSGLTPKIKVLSFTPGGYASEGRGL